MNDFFARQDQARRNTAWLVLLYGLCVALIIVSVYAVIAFSLGTFGSGKSNSGVSSGREDEFQAVRLWEPQLFLITAGATILLIGAGAAGKFIALREGGAAIARMLGGEPVPPDTTNPAERQLRNVVEEMAIASGIPVPQIFVLPGEGGINAFAAGFSPRDAAVAVTRGSLRRLTRDELQGVIAHEFSHLLNGDMGMNLRLLALLNGILLLYITGRVLLQSTRFTSSSRSEKKGGNPLPMIGLGLMVVGLIGVFFARLIQSAISRQREFLADAAAVQFTRNPAGLAGALKKIAGLPGHGVIASPDAENAAHLFFASGLDSFWSRLFTTHPPLEARIRRLDPAFDGRLPDLAESEVEADDESAVAALVGGGRRDRGIPPRLQPDAAPASPWLRNVSLAPDQVLTHVGVPLPEHMAQAAALLAALPAELMTAAHYPGQAVNLVYALLLDADPGVREKQCRLLTESHGASTLEQVLQFTEATAALPPEARLPLAQITAATLRSLPEAERDRLLDNLDRLAGADNQISLFEYMLRRLFLRQLRPASFTAPGRRKTPPADDARIVLSTLAWVGSADFPAAERAYAAGHREMLLANLGSLLPADLCGLGPLDGALERLAQSGTSVKQRLVAACVATIGTDGLATVEEAELLRAVADSLDIPLPPLAATPREG